MATRLSMVSNRKTPTDSDEQTRSETDDGGGSTRTTSRRGLLKGVAAAGLSVPIFTSRASATHDREDDYRSVVNVVDEGADPDGDDPINDVLDDIRDDDTLLHFPDGRYRMDRRFRFTDFENFGVHGDGATLVPDDYDDFQDRGGNYWLFRLGTSGNPGGKLLVEGLDVDQTADETGVRAINAVADERLEIRDVTVHGTDDLGSEGPLRVGTADSDTTGIVENFSATDGSLRPEQVPNEDDLYMGTTGINATWPCRGELTLKDCNVHGFSGTGLYAVCDSGTTLVLGGSYQNSGVAQIRLGGHNCEIKNAYVGVHDRDDHYSNQRGVRIEGSTGRTYVIDTTIEVTEPNGHAFNVQDGVEDLRVYRLDVTVEGDRVNHGVVLYDSLEKGFLDSSSVELNTPGGYGIWIMDSDHDGRVLLEQTEVTGDADTESFSTGIRCHRDGAEFRQTTVDQTSDEHYRSALENHADDIYVYDCEFYSEYHPVVSYGDNTWIEKTYADSYGGQEGVKITAESDSSLVKRSTIVGGIDADGDYFREWDNEFN